jgi:hypothetical protein
MTRLMASVVVRSDPPQVFMAEDLDAVIGSLLGASRRSKSLKVASSRQDRAASRAWWRAGGGCPRVMDTSE